MNHNGKRVKHEATRLTEAQRCYVIAKLSKPNLSSKRAPFDGTNSEEYCDVMLKDADEVLETMRIEGEPPIDDEIQPTEKVVEPKSVTNFKGFEAPQSIVLDINNQLLCSDVRTEVGQLYDELQRTFETF